MTYNFTPLVKQKKIISHITQWLIDYIKGCSQKGFVVGISGGIDSSVVSTICALTEKKTIVLSMPIKQIKEQSGCLKIYPPQPQ